MAEKSQDLNTQEKAIIYDGDDQLKPTLTTDAGQIEELDEAGLFLREHNFSQAYLAELLEDKDLNKKIIRRIDWTLMPLLCGTYFLQYIDKQALSYSAVYDLFPSTNMTSNQYSWLASIFYFAYLVAEWPSSYLAQHYPTGRVVACFVMVWGSIMLITASCSNFTGMAICRFLLGTFESVITPCFMMIVSMWYVKAEQPSRAGTFYCFNGVGSMTGGILFYAIGHAKGFPIWKIIFILCGGVTVLWGILLFFYLPSSIMSAKAFNPEQKALLIARSQTNRTGVYNRKIKRSQIVEALTDPQVWMLFFFTLLNEVINGGVANFGKLIVKGVAGNDPLRATAYGIPQGAFQVVFVFSGPWLASRFKNSRTIIMALYICPTIIGATLMWKMPRSNTVGCLLGYYIVSIDFSDYTILTSPFFPKKNNWLTLSQPPSDRQLRRIPRPRTPTPRHQRGRLHQTRHGHGICLPGLLLRQRHRPARVPGPRSPHLPDRLQGDPGLRGGPDRPVARSAHVAHLAQQTARPGGFEAQGAVNLEIEADDADLMNDLTDFQNPKFRYAY